MDESTVMDPSENGRLPIDGLGEVLDPAGVEGLRCQLTVPIA